MLYVGAYVHFVGEEKSLQTKIRTIETLGHSRGRAERFLDSHPPIALTDGEHYRAIVFAMPEGFRLRNDVIKLTIRKYNCDWQTAKFHCYRLAAQDAIGRQDVWQDLHTKQQELQAAQQTTAAPLSEASATDPLISNIEVAKEYDTVKL